MFEMFLAFSSWPHDAEAPSIISAFKEPLLSLFI